jgi:HEAT repeat protein
MPDKAREVLQHLVEARAAIDRHDSEWSSPPYKGYEAARAELDSLEPGERAKLAEGLTDSNSAVRIEAAKALEYLVLTEARPGLERGLADPALAVRDACAKALATISPASALSTIVEQGVTVSMYTLSSCAQAAVAALGAGALAWVVKSGLSPSGGEEAWAALYELDPHGASKALEPGLTTGNRYWALGVSRLVLAKGGEWARPAFSVLVRHPDTRVAHAAAEVLVVLGDETRTDAILAFLSNTSNVLLRDLALQASFEIARRTETPVAERVIAIATHAASEQRLLMEELARLAGCAWEAAARGPILGAVRKALSHSDEATVTAAVRAATAWGFDELVDEVRRNAANALGKVGGPSARVRLEPPVHDNEPEVRSAAGQPLKRLRPTTFFVPSARAWIKPPVHGGEPLVRGAAEQASARPRPASGPAARLFPAYEATSPNGRFLLVAESPEEHPSLDQWSGFRYRLLERGAGSRASPSSANTEARVVWERWQNEGPPRELVVSDEGWSVLRTDGRAPDVIAVSPAGNDAVRVLIHRPRWNTETGPDRAYRFGWEVELGSILLGGPLLWAWRSFPYFVQVDGMAFFVWRTSWGQRLVLDLTHETLLPEDSPARAALARAMDEEEKRSAYRLLLNLSVHLYEAQEFLARRARTPHLIGPVMRVPAAIHLVGLHRHHEALPLLRLWEAIDQPASSQTTFAMGHGWLAEAQFIRPILHHALRLLGEEPQGYATYHFRKADGARFAVAQHVTHRRERAAELHLGMSAEQVLRLVGSPDHIRRTEYNGMEEWEYDFLVADQWVTLRLLWEGHRVTVLQEEPAYWLESAQRVLEIEGF